jgi:hypothetical protein
MGKQSGSRTWGHDMKAFAWQSGLIEFGNRVPEGTLLIVEGPAKRVRSAVDVMARHSRTNDQLLVPGIPEAETDDDKLDALLVFAAMVRGRLART